MSNNFIPKTEGIWQFLKKEQNKMDLREMQFAQAQNQITEKQSAFKYHSHSSG